MFYNGEGCNDEWFFTKESLANNYAKECNKQAKKDKLESLFEVDSIWVNNSLKKPLRSYDK